MANGLLAVEPVDVEAASDEDDDPFVLIRGVEPVLGNLLVRDREHVDVGGGRQGHLPVAGRDEQVVGLGDRLADVGGQEPEAPCEERPGDGVALGRERSGEACLLLHVGDQHGAACQHDEMDACSGHGSSSKGLHGATGRRRDPLAVPRTVRTMHVLAASGLRHAYDGRVLFDDLSFGLTDRGRVAIVGPNGSGKSTLLRIVAADLAPDAGEVVTSNDARISYLQQAPDHPAGATSIDVVSGPVGVLLHEAEALLDRLQVDPGAPLGTLSGGQRRRVALAAALLPPADLLILDEPTNHLDGDTVDWLEQHLAARSCGLLFVTHDRLLLQRLTTRMLDLNDVPTWVDGSWSDVIEARLERRDRQANAEQRRRNLWRKELAWLQRGPKARTSKPKFRLEQAASLRDAEVDLETGQLDLGTGRRRLGTKVLEAAGLTVEFGAHRVLDGVDLHVGPGERVGLVGPNGAGKTTLLRVLTGEVVPDGGTVVWGPTVEVASYDQEVAAAPADVQVLDTITSIAPWIPLANGDRVSASALAERFGFDSRLQRASVRLLSGGERRRLALLHVLVTAPNVLILDEPTNDLDIDTLQALEDHLDGFRGTLIVATHDRYVLDRLTDRLLSLEHGRLVPYLDWEAYRDARARVGSPAATAPSDTAAHNRRRQERKRELRSLDQRIARLEKQRIRLEHDLADVGADYERAASVSQQRQQVLDELADLEDRWLELTIDD